MGLRVADKRENEYQSGKKLQYKSACYFFKIDKEHIIDATCKGGIARFVNHSCSVILCSSVNSFFYHFVLLTQFSHFAVDLPDQPNCVAKVMSVRNEKKVIWNLS